jgi:hypothetical protein
MKSLSGKDLEIAKAISEWLLNLGYSKSLESFLEETSIKKDDIPKTKVLDKKWTTILTMQKKVNDLENKIKTMKEEYEQASVTGLSYNTKTDTGSTMVNLYISNLYLLRDFQEYQKNIQSQHIELQFLV